MGYILIVEDESDICELLEYNLKKDGYSTKAVNSGEDAFARIKSKKPILVILDLMLPGIQGMEFLKQIKADPNMSDIPVIILSAKTSETDRVLGLELGADDYVSKPFSVKEMVSRVKAVLRRTGKSEPKADRSFRYKELFIDFNSVTVKVKGRKVHLSPYEFKILSFLVQHPGKAYSRDELLDHVWEGEAFVQPRTVDVHIRRLRALIEKDAKQPEYIKTVRGFGYIFEPER